MKNIEYYDMANLYDKFYQKKNYHKEVEFINKFINDKKCKILDAGCGTGNHASILNEQGFEVYGFDKSLEMVKIANHKILGRFYVNDLLTCSNNKKYDLIISFFAVFNHLKSYKEFAKALNNLKQMLNKNGSIIIDMHNPQKSGNKTEKYDFATRKMSWRLYKSLKKEYTKIIYIVDGKKYKTKHVFRIFDMDKLENIAKELGFKKIEFFENYNYNSKATITSKNIQMVVSL